MSEERLWPVPSLDVRNGVDSAAAALFIERAEAVTPGCVVDRQNAVVEICRRLDGIPLAIELAASRLVSMTVIEVRDRLGDRFPVTGRVAARLRAAPDPAPGRAVVVRPAG